MTTPTLKLSGAYEHQQLDELCQALGSTLADRSSAPPLLDLTDLRSLASANLAIVLASIAERYPGLGPESLAVPTDCSSLSCLGEQALRELMVDESGHWQDRGDGKVIGTLVFSARMDIYRFLGDLMRHLQFGIGLGSDTQRGVYFLLFELVSIRSSTQESRGAPSSSSSTPQPQR